MNRQIKERPWETSTVRWLHQKTLYEFPYMLSMHSGISHDVIKAAANATYYEDGLKSYQTDFRPNTF